MKKLILKHKNGVFCGICSVCSAHPLVIEAALRFELTSDRNVLIEATSNQVNQFGGYTGMKPAQFRDVVYTLAQQIAFPLERLILGGDHLGPHCWQNEPAAEAMAKARTLIAEYVQADFRKIHLDTSMPYADDPVPLPPDVVAERAAELYRVAEESATEEQRAHLTYVIGTEVPVPGGETRGHDALHISHPDDVAQTIALHYQAFNALGLQAAIPRIIAVVVQPGVDFDNHRVIHYQPEAATALRHFIETTPLIYEAHSTDYQSPAAYQALVRDHFAILKVGPALTFALREAVYALAMIEQQLVLPERQSQVLAVIEQVMLDQPSHWKNHYRARFSHSLIDIHYGLSDRIRYYWSHRRILAAIETLLSNLAQTEIPQGLLSQYLPVQFVRVREGQIAPHPHALIIDKVQDVLRDYAAACDPAFTLQPELYHA